MQKITIFKATVQDVYLIQSRLLKNWPKGDILMIVGKPF